jgi:predicted RNase H-like nuclease (RuvC/YqgF family)
MLIEKMLDEGTIDEEEYGLYRKQVLDGILDFEDLVDIRLNRLKRQKNGFIHKIDKMGEETMGMKSESEILQEKAEAYTSKILELEGYIGQLTHKKEKLINKVEKIEKEIKERAWKELKISATNIKDQLADMNIYLNY